MTERKFELDQNEWDAMQTRLLRIEDLLIANAKVDVNGAPMRPEELDPTSSDVIRTIKMAFEQSGMTFRPESLNYSGNRAWTNFRYGRHFYTISVEREVNE